MRIHYQQINVRKKAPTTEPLQISHGVQKCTGLRIKSGVKAGSLRGIINAIPPGLKWFGA